MTKKIVLASAIATALFHEASAQENALRFLSDSANNEQVRRNEIGINIAPAATILLGAYPEVSKFSASIKRIIKEKNALRLSVSYQPNWNNNYWYDLYNYEIISQTDSTQLRRYTQHYTTGKPQLNLGYEWRKGKKKIKYFFGSDLILGGTNHSIDIYDAVYRLEQGNPQGLTYGNNGDTLFYLVPDYSIPNSSVKTEHTKYYYAGISPFLGILCPLSKRFSLSAQIGVDAAIGYGKTIARDYIQKTTTEYFSYTLDFNSAGIVNDLSLVYRF